MERTLINTGTNIELGDRYEAKIRQRREIVRSNGISVLNSPGTVDSDFRREVCIILIYLSKDNFVIHDRDLIYQMIITKYKRASWKEVKVLYSSHSGTEGFAHTGGR